MCSGIEAATVAWEPLGWEPVFFSEIDPFPCELLKTKYPNVPNRGDMTKYKEWSDEQIDVYKALGNSMAVPVMRWIGERIALVDAL